MTVLNHPAGHPDGYTDLALELASAPNALDLTDDARWHLAALLHHTGNDMAAWRARDVIDIHPTDWADVETAPAVNPWLPALLFLALPITVVALLALGFANR